MCYSGCSRENYFGECTVPGHKALPCTEDYEEENPFDEYEPEDERSREDDNHKGI